MLRSYRRKHVPVKRFYSLDSCLVIFFDPLIGIFERNFEEI